MNNTTPLTAHARTHTTRSPHRTGAREGRDRARRVGSRPQAIGIARMPSRPNANPSAPPAVPRQRPHDARPRRGPRNLNHSAGNESKVRSTGDGELSESSTRSPRSLRQSDLTSRGRQTRRSFASQMVGESHSSLRRTSLRGPNRNAAAAAFLHRQPPAAAPGPPLALPSTRGCSTSGSQSSRASTRPTRG